MVNTAFITPSSCKKQINKQNSYFLLTFLQSGSVPELDMHESKHFLPGPCERTILTNDFEMLTIISIEVQCIATDHVLTI
jgi:hypothetical protein